MSKKQYVIFSKHIPASEKYSTSNVRTIPKFPTRKAAEKFIKEHNIKDVKVLVL